jgi:hypothetical protein
MSGVYLLGCLLQALSDTIVARGTIDVKAIRNLVRFYRLTFAAAVTIEPGHRIAEIA